jgi:dihydroflavonol-4-reductase
VNRTWLVTGATGFLGRHLVRELLGRGDHVRALVRSVPTEPLPAGVEIHHGDVLTEETLDPAIEGTDGVFHLAGRVSRDGATDALHALHVDGTANVLRAMGRTGCSRLVLASTSGTVAVSADPAVHDDGAAYAIDVTKRWPYYASKIRAEQVARGMARSLGIELVILRPSLLLGPEDFASSSTDDVRRFVAGEYPIVPKGGLSFVDVRDCATTFANAMDRGNDGEAYLVSSANMTLRDFFVLVANIADVEPPVAEIPRRAWQWGVRAVQTAAWLGYVETIDRASVEMAEHYWYCDWSRAVVELGHAPRPPVETLEDTVAWLQAWGEIPEAAEPGKLLRLPFRPRS